MDDDIMDRLIEALRLSWPSLPVEGIADADLVFDHNVDRDSLEEFLLEQEEKLGLRFNIDLQRFYPGWFSPFFDVGNTIFAAYSSKIAKRLHPSLTFRKIFDSAIEE